MEGEKGKGACGTSAQPIKCMRQDPQIPVLACASLKHKAERSQPKNSIAPSQHAQRWSGRHNHATAHYFSLIMMCWLEGLLQQRSDGCKRCYTCHDSITDPMQHILKPYTQFHCLKVPSNQHSCFVSMHPDNTYATKACTYSSPHVAATRITPAAFLICSLSDFHVRYNLSTNSHRAASKPPHAC